MTRIATVSLIAIASMVSPLLARSGGVFLKQGFGANATGLGRAYGATVKDPSALYWNPAGLAHINGETKTIRKIDPVKDAEDAFKNDPAFGDLESEGEGEGEAGAAKPKPAAKKPVETIERTFELQFHASYGYLALDRQVAFSGIGLTAFGGSLGAGALGTKVEGISGFDSAGNSTGALQYNGGAAYLGYAFQTEDVTRIGFSLMGMQEQLGATGTTINGGALNVGIQKLVFPFIEAGFDIQNLAGVVQERSADTEQYEKLDSIMRTSLSIVPPAHIVALKLFLALRVNLDDPQDDGLSGHFGLAVPITSFSFLMLGIDGGQFSGGLGLKLKVLQISYAVNRDPLGIGLQHFGELNFVF